MNLLTTFEFVDYDLQFVSMNQITSTWFLMETNFSRDEMSVTFSTFLSEKLRDEGSFRQKKKCQSKVCKILRKWWIMSNVSYFSLLSMLLLHTAVTHIPLYEFLTQIKSTRDSRNFKGMIDAATTSSSSYFKTWKIKSTEFGTLIQSVVQFLARKL